MAEGKGPSSGDQVSVGQYLAHRLVEAGVRDFFTVPGDFNMVLLDEMLKNAGLTFIGCCNELNAGYAADGYARGSGKLGVVVGESCFYSDPKNLHVVVTYMVGALSLINAVAGAFSDDLPLLVVVGSPNTNDLVERHVVHHSLGSGSLDQCRRAFDPVVTHVFSVYSPKDAPGNLRFAGLALLTYIVHRHD
jgi:pyruvate decarboxylase